MSITLYCLGRLEDAQQVADDAVELARDFFGHQSETALDAMCVQGHLLGMSGRVEEAKATVSHVLAESTRVLGPEHHMTRDTERILLMLGQP